MASDTGRGSLLKADHVRITDGLSVRIPTVGEILDDEQKYYNDICSLTAAPIQYMVQLDDIGIDFAQINEWDLFLMVFPAFAETDTSMIFGDADLSDAKAYQMGEDDAACIYSPKSGIMIDINTYLVITDAIRRINLLKKDKRKPGNESARKYLLEKERRRLKHHAKDPWKPYLENLVIALVNTSEFPYDYDSCMGLSIYRFNQSLKQIQHKINFDNTMRGVYAGTVDIKKMADKDSLSWIQNSDH